MEESEAGEEIQGDGDNDGDRTLGDAESSYAEEIDDPPRLNEVNNKYPLNFFFEKKLF